MSADPVNQMPRVTDWSPDDVDALLERVGFSSSEPTKLIGSGHWSDCFSFVHQQRALVCRVGNEREDFDKDRFASRFRAPGLPAPQVLDVGDCGAQHYAISEQMFGEPLEQTSSWKSLINPVTDLLEALRVTNVDDMEGWGRWNAEGHGVAASWSEFVLRVANDPPGGRMTGWKSKLEALPDAAAAFEDGYALLEQLVSDDVPRALVHNDLYHRNVLTDGKAITGVFDWGISFLGDPLYDVAMLCFWSPWFDDIDEQPLLAELRRRWPASAVVDVADRFTVCMLHMALEHIGYTAALGNDEQVAKIVARLDVVTNTTW